MTDELFDTLDIEYALYQDFKRIIIALGKSRVFIATENVISNVVQVSIENYHTRKDYKFCDSAKVLKLMHKLHNENKSLKDHFITKFFKEMKYIKFARYHSNFSSALYWTTIFSNFFEETQYKKSTVIEFNDWLYVEENLGTLLKLLS
jgi:DNA-binding MltR family transcriptional regulator